MSTDTFDATARQDTRRLTNSALLRVLSVAAFSVVFALIDCAVQVDTPSYLTASSASGSVAAPTRATTAAMADSFDPAASAGAPMRRN